MFRSGVDDVAPKYLIGLQKVLWEDYDFIQYEASRVGPGEHGKKVILTDPEEIKKNDEWMAKEGFYVGVSDMISLSRALPDHRPDV